MHTRRLDNIVLNHIESFLGTSPQTRGAFISARVCVKPQDSTIVDQTYREGQGYLCLPCP